MGLLRPHSAASTGILHSRCRFPGARLLVLLGSLGLLILAIAAPSASSAPSPINPPANAWPEFHHDPSLSGSSPDPLITASSAPDLGVRWMASTHAPDGLSSPVAAWNATLSKTLVFDGNEGGYVTAFDAANGSVVWSDRFHQPIRATPLSDGAYVWIVTYNGVPGLYKLNASTGAIVCSVHSPRGGDATPVLATPPGGRPTIYLANNIVIAVDESTCEVDWTWDGFTTEPTGVWGPESYAVSANGTPLLLFGSDDPDSTVYALNASTGQLVWENYVNPPPGDFDIGAGVVVSSPGTNGFADGVAYWADKDGMLGAIDLTTGHSLWSWTEGPIIISTPALAGSVLVEANTAGEVAAINAVDGVPNGTTPLWTYFDDTSVLSSPAVIGPNGNQIVAFTDRGGSLKVLSMATGALLFTFQTHGYSVSSPADVDGNLLFGSADGFLYDLDIGGGSSVAPVTSVTSPASGTTVPNPQGMLTISGSATDPAGVSAVDVAVQLNGSTGPWWNASTGKWTSGVANDPATLLSPGSTSTTWLLKIPCPHTAAAFEVLANAVSAGGIADTTAGSGAVSAAVSTFTVQSVASAPLLSLSSSRVPPGGTLTVSGSHFDPNDSITLSIFDQDLTTVTANSTGSFAAIAVTVPSNDDSFGATAITATGQSSGDVGSAVVVVANEWTQYLDDPLHADHEANDSVLFDDQQGTFAPGGLAQAWTFDTGAPITSSPVVAGGFAYVANDAGTVDAIDVSTGTDAGSGSWSVNLGAAITSSPALATSGALSLIVMGTGGANSSTSGGCSSVSSPPYSCPDSIVALNASTGAIVWSTRTSADAPVGSSPTVSDGVVYIADESGNLYALSVSTGAIVWSTALDSEILSSPAVDKSAGTVVVGDDAGAVTALSTGADGQTAGSKLWSFSAAGEVVASPLITDGSVIVGSTGGVVYSLSESSGAENWTFSTTHNQPVQVAAAINGGGKAVLVGDAGGNVYQLSITGSGSVTAITSMSLGSSIAGLAANTSDWFVELGNGRAFMFPSDQPYMYWSYTAGAPFASPPVVVDGAAYVAGEDGQLRCFVYPGLLP